MPPVVDWTPYIVLFLGSVIVPALAYLVSTTITVASKLKAHEATDAIHFKNIADRLTDLQNESGDQSKKLDRLIERFL